VFVERTNYRGAFMPGYMPLNREFQPGHPNLDNAEPVDPLPARLDRTHRVTADDIAQNVASTTLSGRGAALGQCARPSTFGRR